MLRTAASILLMLFMILPCQTGYAAPGSGDAWLAMDVGVQLWFLSGWGAFRLPAAIIRKACAGSLPVFRMGELSSVMSQGMSWRS